MFSGIDLLELFAGEQHDRLSFASLQLDVDRRFRWPWGGTVPLQVYTCSIEFTSCNLTTRGSTLWQEYITFLGAVP